jgi:hypothetical protein
MYTPANDFDIQICKTLAPSAAMRAQSISNISALITC